MQDKKATEIPAPIYNIYDNLNNLKIIILEKYNKG